ncbi:YhgE/Pip domain-containing protein [Bacillus cereus group sp. BfR-BA-01380]|uniref:YhgE/Pip domain-containing protein n=1 Tax=Bacillus cereus group sp. BfR-BA-01380 TaxID=2920324 RepID=UPI001F5A01C7|nr:YhgE/Pip domain-containing protein [Bacillus cereus group sp. BfR-BA-01380]
MRGLKLLGKEFATIIKSKTILIPIIAVLFIPLLYAATFLWAFWDPYGQLDDLPVAVVNLDKGAVYNGKELEVGNELVDNLKENKSFKWDFVSEKEAKKGMDNRKYYMTIRIPKDFSKDATTLLEASPQKLKLEYIPNEGINYLFSKIGETATEKIKGEVSSTLTKTYAENMFDSLKDVSKGFSDARDGANQLHDGTGELKDGSGKVTDGLNTLNSKTGEMQTGIGKLLDGSQKISGGLGQFIDPKGEFQGGLGKLTSGSQQIAGGLGESATGSQQIAGGLGQFVDPKGEFQTGLASLFGGSNQLANGLGQLQGGQEKLATGATDIQKGIQDTNAGLKKSLAGVTDMQGKLPELTSGSELVSSLAQNTAGSANKAVNDLAQLQEKINGLPEEYKKELAPTVQELVKDNKDVVAGAKQTAGTAKGVANGQKLLQAGVIGLQKGQQLLVEGTDKLAAGQQRFIANFQTFGEKLKEATTGASTINGGLDQLSTKATAGLGQLYTGANKLAGGLGQLSTGANQLESGLGDLSGKATAGLGQLSTGANQLAGGLGELSSGSKQMANGVSQLADGSGKVTEGLAKANDGSSELATKLGEGAEKTSETKGNDKIYEMFASPVKVKTEKITEVPNYGTGFTPYFLSLGLLVGALLLTIVFPLRETVGIPKSGFSWFISKFGVVFTVGVIQAVIVDAVLLLGLGVKVQSVPYFILFSIITSLAFITLVQFFVTMLGDVGRFIMILLMILQLTTSAGTFPLELIPKPLQVFYGWLPMTYSIAGYRAVISSGDFGFMWQNAGMLMIFIVLLSLGTIGTFTWMHKRQYGKFSEAE